MQKCAAITQNVRGSSRSSVLWRLLNQRPDKAWKMVCAWRTSKLSNRFSRRGIYKYQPEIYSSWADAITAARRNLCRAQDVPWGSAATAESQPANWRTLTRRLTKPYPWGWDAASFNSLPWCALQGLWAEIQDKWCTWHQAHECTSLWRRKRWGSDWTSSNMYVTQSCPLPTMLHCPISNSLIQAMVPSSVSKLTHNTVQSQMTRKMPAPYANTGRTALFMFPKVARPSSSLRQFSASTAGFSSLSAAEGEDGGPMRLEGKRNHKHNVRILTPVLKLNREDSTSQKWQNDTCFFVPSILKNEQGINTV